MGIADSEAEAAVQRVGDEVGHHDEAAARALLTVKRRLAGVKAARFLAGRGVSTRS